MRIKIARIALYLLGFGAANLFAQVVPVEAGPRPSIPYDQSVSELITTRTLIEQDRSLPRDGTVCRPRTEDGERGLDQLLAYVDCMHASAAGLGTVVQVREDRTIPETYDSARSFQISIEFKGPLANGIWQLPSPEIRVFYSNCRHSWLFRSGCGFGSKVIGTLQIENLISGTGSLILDITIQADQFSPMYASADARTTAFRIYKRVAIGKPIRITQK